MQEPHVARCEGTGFVAAQDVHAAEVLDRCEVFDDDVMLRHPQRSLTERYGGNHRQELWREPDGQRHSEEQRLEWVMAACEGDHKREERQEDHRSHDEEAESPDTPVEFSLRRACGESLDNIAQRGRVPGGEYQR